MIKWRQIQRKNFTCWKALSAYLQLDPAHFPAILKQSRFPLNFPYRLAQKVEKNRWDDPILQQFLPQQKEREEDPLFKSDPVGDCFAQKTGKLLQKYQSRALLLTTSSCAMHCRYCFRQNYDYVTHDKSFAMEIDLLEQDTSLREVILSGGDPLSLSDTVLKNLLRQLDAIAHLKRIRFHTRFPIAIPERIDESFLSLLQETRLQVIFVIHCNHPRELDDDVLCALKKIQCLGIPVLNQTVLLKGINDRVDVLKELCEQLTNHGILPYYLHQLDRVQGAMHFEVEEKEGKRLHAQLTQVLSGYAVPKYVREEAGQPSKTEIL